MAYRIELLSNEKMKIGIAEKDKHNYPIVKIPYFLDELDAIDFPLPEQPLAPIKPEKKSISIQKDMKIEHVSIWLPLMRCLLFIICILGPLILTFHNMTTYIICSILAIILISLVFNAYFYDKKFAPSKNNDWQNFEESLHKYLLKQYEKKYEHYLIDLEKYKEESKKIILEYRLNHIKGILDSTTKPVLHINANNILSGVSEDSFFKKLQSSFGDNVLKDYTLPYRNGGYLPDIVFYEKNTGLCIDIEIDEPYIGSTGEPIHYKGNLYDEERNKVFLRENWIIIRFAEEQIVNYSDECCDFIIQTIEDITKMLISANTFSYVKGNKKLVPINQWTKEDAHKLAFLRYRNTYLPQNLVEKISLESIDWIVNKKL